jgi:hypothetical protein
MAESDITKRPKRNAKDVGHALAKAGLGIIAGPASELFSLVITPSLEKRRDEWIESIAEGMKALEAQLDGFKIENLCENEKFVSTVMQASQAAIRNHQKEKLDAFRNAVLNAALPNAPDQGLQLMFLNFIDSFTSWHLALLVRLDESEVVRGKEVDGFCPELHGQQAFYHQVIKDLHSRGLTHLQPPSDTTVYSRQFEPTENVTDFGKQFLQFITSPVGSNT